jgi:adenylosuccinate synthase
MPVTIVAGAQWGDEGKGRVVDLLAAEADIVVRCQGGPNAGHTVINDQGRFALHGVPSGIFNARCLCAIGAGTVIDSVGLVAELRSLQQAGVDVSRLLISERAHLILPYHRAREAADEEGRGPDAKIGATGQGIAPTYADKAARCGLRAGDLLDLAVLRGRLQEEVARSNAWLAALSRPALVASAIWEEVEAAAAVLAPYIGDTVEPLTRALGQGQRVLLEGQLGVMRDIDWGAYPFVTSSSPTPAGMLAGAGLPPTSVDRVIGVTKAYTSAVGTGPFPTELTGEQGEWLRERGAEYGATTGRPRRCGWFDAVAVAWAARVAGFTELALTKIDVLDGLTTVPMAVAYPEDARFPATRRMAAVQPTYEEFAGWEGPTRGVQELAQLPAAAQAYIDEIERRVGVPITLVSTGPEREAMVARDRA